MHRLSSRSLAFAPEEPGHSEGLHVRVDGSSRRGHLTAVAPGAVGHFGGRPLAGRQRQKALDFGAAEFVDLENVALDDVCGVDLVFDVIGGDIQERSAGMIRAQGTLVTIAGPSEARPADGLAIDFVVLPIVPNWMRSSSGCGTDGCGRTSATSRHSTMPLQPSTRPSGSAGRR